MSGVELLEFKTDFPNDFFLYLGDANTPSERLIITDGIGTPQLKLRCAEIKRRLL
jgi:hypothetical protein